jgi:hypothetical protein
VLQLGGAARRGGLHGLDPGGAGNGASGGEVHLHGGVLLAVARAGGDRVVGDEGGVLCHGGRDGPEASSQGRGARNTRCVKRTAGGAGKRCLICGCDGFMRNGFCGGPGGVFIGVAVVGRERWAHLQPPGSGLQGMGEACVAWARILCPNDTLVDM